jgi:hypothetical protein
VTAYRDSLPEARHPAYDTAIGRAAQVYVDACAEQARIVAAEGPRAAAEQAWYPGHRLSVEALAEQIAALHGKRQAA